MKTSTKTSILVSWLKPWGEFEDCQSEEIDAEIVNIERKNLTKCQKGFEKEEEQEIENQQNNPTTDTKPEEADNHYRNTWIAIENLNLKIELLNWKGKFRN